MCLAPSESLCTPHLCTPSRYSDTVHLGCSIRAPRLRPAGAAEPEPWAREAKEALRKAAIGAAADVTLEYSRQVAAPPGPRGDGGAAQAETTMQFGNAVVAGKSGKYQLAEMMVRRGLAAVQVCAA